MRRIFYLVVSFLFIFLITSAQNNYVGAKMCGMCHKGEKKGAQFETWQKSKHAEAYKTLTGNKAAEIIKAKGFKKAANESPECLSCHTLPIDDAKLIIDGVQCESCHGAGSSYKAFSIMKDTAKAFAAGLTNFKEKDTIEKKCKTCHNEKSPSYKPFKFEEMWEKIKHSIPKG